MGLFSCATGGDLPSKREIILDLDRQRQTLEHDLQRDRQKLATLQKEGERFARERESWEREKADNAAELERRSALLELAMGRCQSLAAGFKTALEQLSNLSSVEPPIQQQQEKPIILPERISVAIEIAAYDPHDLEEEQALATAASEAAGSDWKRRKVVVLRLSSSGGGGPPPEERQSQEQEAMLEEDPDGVVHTPHTRMAGGTWEDEGQVLALTSLPPPQPLPLEVIVASTMEGLEVRGADVLSKLKDLSQASIVLEGQRAELVVSP